MKETDEIKKKIFQIAAVTDRGQRLNKLIAPVYQDKLIEMDDLIESLKIYSSEISEESLSGEWELIYSNVELSCSTPFFFTNEKELNN